MLITNMFYFPSSCLLTGMEGFTTFLQKNMVSHFLRIQNIFLIVTTMIKIALSPFSIMPVLSKSPHFRLVRLTRKNIHDLANSLINA